MVQMAQVETMTGKYDWSEKARLSTIADLEARDADCVRFIEKARLLEAERVTDAESHEKSIAALEGQLTDIRSFMESMQQQVASSAAPSVETVKSSEAYVEPARIQTCSFDVPHVGVPVCASHPESGVCGDDRLQVSSNGARTRRAPDRTAGDTSAIEEGR
jgi:hypothetical protein